MDGIVGARTPRSKKPRGPKESVIQAQVMKWLRAQPDCLAWVVKSMGTYDAKRKSFRKPPGWFRPGVPDVHVIVNGHYVMIELKSEFGKLSEAQEAFVGEFSLHRAPNMFLTVCHSLDEVRDKINVVRGFHRAA